MARISQVRPEEAMLVSRLLDALLWPRAQPPQLQPRFTTIGRIHFELRLNFGFRLVEKKLHYGGPTTETGEPVGPLLIWRNGRVVVRAKTRGEPATAKFRQGLAHLSVCLLSGALDKNGRVDTSFHAEVGKFDATGALQPKSPAGGTPTTWRHKAAGETWADNTHFLFPDLVCGDENVDALEVEAP